MNRVWSIKQYEPGDEEGIFELDKAVHPSPPKNIEAWLRWWQWMYGQNPAGAGIVWLAQHEGRIVGQSALVPVSVKFGTRVLAGFQAVDTMTHPEYRRQGIYETLARKTYAEAGKRGIHLGYRFPNQNSYPIAVNKLGWIHVATMQLMLKPLNWEKALKLLTRNEPLIKLGALGGTMSSRVLCHSKKPPFVEDLTINRVASFDERINKLWAAISAQYPLAVARNRDYLNWRYINAVGEKYLTFTAEVAGEIQGYNVLRCLYKREVKCGVFCDILTQSEEIAHHLVSEAMKYFEQEKVDLVYFTMINNRLSKTLFRAFRRSGFISIPFIKGMRLCAYSSSPDIPKDFIRDSENWLIQSGDSDSV